MHATVKAILRAGIPDGAWDTERDIRILGTRILMANPFRGKICAQKQPKTSKPGPPGGPPGVLRNMPAGP